MSHLFPASTLTNEVLKKSMCVCKCTLSESNAVITRSKIYENDVSSCAFLFVYEQLFLNSISRTTLDSPEVCSVSLGSMFMHPSV